MFYILNEKYEPVETTLEDQAIWQKNNSFQLFLSEVFEVMISTDFLGIDVGFPRDRNHPIVFETKTYDIGGSFNRLNNLVWRYSTYKEAKAGHKKMEKHIKKEIFKS